MIKKKREKRFFSAFLGVFLLILTILLLFSNWKIGKKRKEVLSRIEELRGKIEEMETQKEQLEEGLSDAETEEYWEERIREQGYKKPGENVVVIKKEEKEEASPSLWDSSEEEINMKREGERVWGDFMGWVRNVFE